MKRTIRTACTLAVAVLLFPGAAMANGDPIASLQSSDKPLVTLDQMDDEEQEVVRDWLDTASDQEIATVFGDRALAQQSRAASSSDSPPFADFAEKATCVIDFGLSDCNKASDDANTATESAISKYPDSHDTNGVGDAYRHCYWSALMVDSVGYKTAAGIGDMHEDYNKEQSLDVRSMDLLNNETGLGVGQDTSSGSEASAKCADLAESGDLETL